MQKCSVNGCQRTYIASVYKMCQQHAAIKRRYGDPLHPEAIARSSHPAEYSVWGNMKQRCFNSAAISYKHYGGRGITVAPEWRDSFLNFYTYIGSRPSDKHSLDRIDTNGNYEPGNVRWATIHQQIYSVRGGAKDTNDYPGVLFDKKKQQWYALLTVNKLHYKNGYFDTRGEALAARLALEKEHNVVVL